MKNIPYATQWIDSDDIRCVNEVLRSDYLTQGPKVGAFENEVAKYCGAKYAVAVSNGTAALHLACLAAGVKNGDEVITSPITFVASANAALYCGARPVFADIKEDTALIDPVEIAKKINKKTKAIIPVDFAGHPADLFEINKIAKKNGLVVIEDAAHALGAVYRGKRVGCGKNSDMTILSFHPVKHITSGEGGMILTDNKEYFEKLKLLRVHGITKEPELLTEEQGPWYYEMQELGFNYRITDFQCALGSSQFKKLDAFVKRRQEIVDVYNNAFSPIDEISPLKTEKNSTSAHHLYILRFNVGSRADIFDAYRESGILVNVHYIPVYYQPYYKKIGYKRGLCPKAEQYYQKAITLPLYPKMSDGDVNRVIKTTKEIISKFNIK